MKLRYDFFETDRVGSLALVASERGLCMVSFIDDDEPWREKLQDRHQSADLIHDPEPLEDIKDWLTRYFAGERVTPEDYPGDLDLGGTKFQRQVWDQLRRIPYGQTRTYGRVAANLENPGAMRAVGLANGQNPLAVFLPCHRVLGNEGKLTGFGGGLWRKSALLELEQGGHQYTMFG